MGDQSSSSVDIQLLASGIAACRLGNVEQLKQTVARDGGVLSCIDKEGRTLLHIAAGYGHEQLVEYLLEQQSQPHVKDHLLDTALHLACVSAAPHPSYLLAQASTETCQMKNANGKTPIDIAVACARGECLNAMLLACAGQKSDTAFDVMTELLQHGAVPDTWAPNGCSALMLAATAGRGDSITLLHTHGATLELQDALGRTALMFAAGNGCAESLQALLDLGASLSVRDRKGRSAIDYAADSEVHEKLLSRLAVLEAEAAVHQAALLELLETENEVPAGAQKGPQKGTTTKRNKKKRDKAAKQKQPEQTDGQTHSGENALEQADEQPHLSAAEDGNDEECAAANSGKAAAAAEQPVTSEVQPTAASINSKANISGSTPHAEGSDDDDADWQVVFKNSKRTPQSAKPQCNAAPAEQPRHTVAQQGDNVAQHADVERSVQRSSSRSSSTSSIDSAGAVFGPSRVPSRGPGACSWAQRVRGGTCTGASSQTDGQTDIWGSHGACRGTGPLTGLLPGFPPPHNATPTFADVAALKAPLLASQIANSSMLHSTASGTSSSDGIRTLATQSGESSGVSLLRESASGGSLFRESASGASVSHRDCARENGNVSESGNAGEGCAAAFGLVQGSLGSLSNGVLHQGLGLGEGKGSGATQWGQGSVREALLEQQVASLREQAGTLQRDLAAANARLQWAEREKKSEMVALLQEISNREAQVLTALFDALQALEQAVLRERAVLALELAADLQSKGLLPPTFMQTTPLPPSIADITATLAAHVQSRQHTNGRHPAFSAKPVYAKNGTRHYAQGPHRPPVPSAGPPQGPPVGSPTNPSPVSVAASRPKGPPNSQKGALAGPFASEWGPKGPLSGSVSGLEEHGDDSGFMAHPLEAMLPSSICD